MVQLFDARSFCGNFKYALTRFSPKHVFSKSNPPSLEHVGKALSTWCNRVRWRRILEREPQSMYRNLRLRPRNTPDAPPVSQDVEMFLRDVSNLVFGRCEKALAASNSKSRSNSNPFVELARRFLRLGPWAILKTDKDGGFGVIDKNLRSEAFKAAMDPRKYTCIARFPGTEMSYIEGYCAAVRKIGRRTEDRELASALFSSIRNSNHEDLFSRVDATVKTHKEQGKVSLRVLHCSVRHPFTSGMRWQCSL